MGREILTFLPGRVARHRPPVGRRRLESVGALVRRFHDATSGSSLTEGREVVCHGELGPHNTLFVRNDAVALIDFDTVHVGSRLDDLDHAAWFFVPLGKDGGTLIEQGQRLRVLCDSYGDCAPEAVLAALAGRFQRVAAWYSERGLQRCEAIFRDSAEWLARHRAPLLAATGRQPRRVPDTDPSTSFG